MAVDPLPTDSALEEPWATRLGHLLWEVTTIITLRGESLFADSPLSLPANGMLDQVIAAPGITVAEIARRLPKTPQAISQVAARLEKLGYVERRLGRGRGVGLYATEAGRAAHVDGHAREEVSEAWLRERLGADRYEELRRLLIDARRLIVEEP